MPYKKFRAGAITATIWNNESQSKENEKIEYKTISFERNYKDKNDEWQTTNSLRTNDLPKAILVLTKAFETISLAENAIREEA